MKNHWKDNSGAKPAVGTAVPNNGQGQFRSASELFQETAMGNAERIALKKAKRAERECALAAQICALPATRYGAILADPSWRFNVWSRETGLGRSADNHYATSTLEQLKAIDVASIAAPDSVLFMWATAPMLPQALEVMKAWGFDYKSQIIWDKEVVGTGYWFRNRHELLLVGTRGKVPAPAMGTQCPSVIVERRRAHSQKPEWAYQMIERYYPNLPRIELFARRARPGWDIWGAEAPLTTEAAE